MKIMKILSQDRKSLGLDFSIDLSNTSLNQPREAEKTTVLCLQWDKINVGKLKRK
jgi:hypothetical protein